MQTPTKHCAHCGTQFSKPLAISMPRWEKRQFCSRVCNIHSRPAPRHPCRICGEPTKYLECIAALKDMVHCGRSKCRKASQAIRDQRISERAVNAYATGRRKATKTWSRVPRVSKEERYLMPWFESRGWKSQFDLTTGNMRARWFRLDFALPEKKLYVEIDGSIHLLQRVKKKDARRNRIMKKIGWRGLRIPSALVRDDPEVAKSKISKFMLTY